MGKVVKNAFWNSIVILVIFSLVTGWVFSGWPQIWKDPPIPPQIEKIAAQSPVTYNYIGSMVQVDISNVYQIDVIILGAGGGDGHSGVGGSGGYVEASFDVSDLNWLEIWVGQAGARGSGGWGRSSGGAGSHASHAGWGGGSTELTIDNATYFLAAADAGGGGGRISPLHTGGGGGAGGVGATAGEAVKAPRTGTGYGGAGTTSAGGHGGQEVNSTYLTNGATETTGGGSGTGTHGKITITYHEYVLPEVSCSVSAVSTDFGLLTADTISTSNPDTNAFMSCTSTISGCTLSIQGTGSSTEPGLWNSVDSYLILSADDTLEAGTEGYGIQATSTDSGWTINTKYAVSGNQVGGMTIAMITLASSTADISTSTVTVIHKAARSAGTPTGSYQDTITYSCTLN